MNFCLFRDNNMKFNDMDIEKFESVDRNNLFECRIGSVVFIIENEYNFI